MDESEVLDGLRYLFKEEGLELLIRLFNLLKVALCDEIHLLTWWLLWLSGPSLLRKVETEIVVTVFCSRSRDLFYFSGIV
ncbi:hypothetical protein H5410_038402 [Solanum commersonii]|uniref:Uncharacterized protein n=1 Tax=Solanum commersonii TaxID=4109 RepID=A0A9J5YAK3_SOLCO|nr:hypothetical protein H5410_038402 [Solanum commersonii]